MEKYLYEQNIHWQNQNYDSGIRRELLDKFKALCDIDQVIAISGISPRIHGDVEKVFY